jgi:hypothetical protein
MRRLYRCACCERDDLKLDEMDSGKHTYCRPCLRDFTNFYRAFKAEHGRRPSMKDFKAEDESPEEIEFPTP